MQKDKPLNLYDMKNFIKNKHSRKLAAIALVVTSIPFLGSCDDFSREDILSSSAYSPSSVTLAATPESVARLLSELPVSLEQVKEVFQAVNASSANGYDEEYTFRDILFCPGRGVGDSFSETRAEILSSGSLGGMLSDYAANFPWTRSAGFIDELASSRLQIYWPYSENWDGESIPTITFRPEIERESNIGFYRETLPDGNVVVKELTIDEAYAVSHPVWVVNWNEDAGAITPQMLEKMNPATAPTRSSSNFKTLKLKEFKAHRQYDSWLSGGSEFYLKTGSLKAFTAEVVSDLKLYNPEITDLMIKVKRSQVGKAIRYNAILVSDWSGQLSECAFLIHEDDGGKMTTWKSAGTVKIKSKSYGFEVEIPYHRNDDIVWRGKLSSNYLTRFNGIAERMGDVSVTFTFD